MFGVLMTNALIFVREALSSGPKNKDGGGRRQNPLTMSAGYATYMATSSNMRYQVVAGVLEERGIEVRTLCDGYASLQGIYASVNTITSECIVFECHVAFCVVNSMQMQHVRETTCMQVLFKGKTNVCHALSLILRTANTFLGSLMWVDFVRLTGLQPASDDKKDKK
jgi:Protein RETICULATA-related